MLSYLLRLSYSRYHYYNKLLILPKNVHLCQNTQLCHKILICLLRNCRKCEMSCRQGLGNKCKRNTWLIINKSIFAFCVLFVLLCVYMWMCCMFVWELFPIYGLQLYFDKGYQMKTSNDTWSGQYWQQ